MRNINFIESLLKLPQKPTLGFAQVWLDGSKIGSLHIQAVIRAGRAMAAANKRICAIGANK